MLETKVKDINTGLKERIKEKEITKYSEGKRDFIDDDLIERKLVAGKNPDPKRIKDILAKSLAIETLTLSEAA